MVDEVARRFVELGKRIHALAEAFKAQEGHDQGWTFADLFSELVDYMRPSESEISEIARRVAEMGGLAAGEAVSRAFAQQGARGKKEPAVGPAEREAHTARMIEENVRDDKIKCMICGKWLRTLAYHLKHSHGMTTDQYLAEQGLTDDFPLVAASYSELRRRNIQQIRDQHGGRMRPLEAAPIGDRPMPDDMEEGAPTSPSGGRKPRKPSGRRKVA